MIYDIEDRRVRLIGEPFIAPNATLIGMDAVVLNGARIGQGCLIGANALVTERMEVPDGAVVLGSPGRIVRTLDAAARQKLTESALRYIENGRRYREHLRGAGGRRGE